MTAGPAIALKPLRDRRNVTSIVHRSLVHMSRPEVIYRSATLGRQDFCFLILSTPPEPLPAPVKEPPGEPEDPHAPMRDPEPDPVGPAQI